jgi:hypothetical protein
VLASLLPGFRHIRSALAAGYMWVFAAWFIGIRLLPNPLGREAILGQPITKLLAILGPAGSLVALSVLCLIVGEFAAGLMQSMFFRFSNKYMQEITTEDIHNVPQGWLRIFRPMSSRAIRRVYSMAQRVQAKRLVDPIADSPLSDSSPVSSEEVAIQALREILFLSPRLIIAKPELYAEYDRIRAEGEFRDAILVPLPILTIGILLWVNVALWVKMLAFALVLIIDVYLFLQARRQFSTAHSIVAHSLADGTISCAAIGDE